MGDFFSFQFCRKFNVSNILSFHSRRSEALFFNPRLIYVYRGSNLHAFCDLPFMSNSCVSFCFSFILSNEALNTLACPRWPRLLIPLSFLPSVIGFSFLGLALFIHLSIKLQLTDKHLAGVKCPSNMAPYSPKRYPQELATNKCMRQKRKSNFN